MLSISIILFAAIINACRGCKFMDMTLSTQATRVFCSLNMAVLAAAYSGNIYDFFIVGAGYMFWATFGWGKYFSAFHGNDKFHEAEIKWIDWISYKIFPPSLSTGTNKARGVLCMGIRGMFMYPMFLVLGAPFAGLLCALQGVPYFLAGLTPKGSIRHAEYMWGAMIGLMLILAL